jgi:hypothetical protein
MRETKIAIQKEESLREHFGDRQMSPDEKDMLYDRLVEDGKKRHLIKEERERQKHEKEELEVSQLLNETRTTSKLD